jgi:hypothetical protein
VIPFFESYDVKLLRILTDRGSEYFGAKDNLTKFTLQQPTGQTEAKRKDHPTPCCHHQERDR